MSPLTDVLTWFGAVVAVMLVFVGGCAACIVISERWRARRDSRELVRELERELRRHAAGKPPPPRAKNPLRPDYPYRDDRRNDE